MAPLALNVDYPRLLTAANTGTYALGGLLLIGAQARYTSDPLWLVVITNGAHVGSCIGTAIYIHWNWVPGTAALPIEEA